MIQEQLRVPSGQGKQTREGLACTPNRNPPRWKNPIQNLNPLNQDCLNTLNPSTVTSGWGGDAGMFSPKIGKIVVESWCYIPGVYTGREKPEVQEIFSKKF